MTIDPITRSKIKNVVFTATEPTSTSVLWAKPDGDKVTMYVFKNGSWVDIKEAGIDPIVQAYIDSQDAATLTSAKEYTDSSVATLEEKVDKKVGAVEIKKNDDSDLQYTLYVDGVAQGAIIIPKDQFLKEVSYNSSTKKLHFVFETSTGEKPTDIDVSDLVDTYTAGNGLSVSNNKFSVVVSADSDSYLTVTEKGIKLSGITSALANKADKSSIPTKVSQLTNDSNYVSKTNADSTYAKLGHKHTKSEITDFPTNVSAFTNDKGYLTEHQDLSAYATTTALETETTRAKGVEDTKLDKTATAVSAGKLATAVSLWGNTFDGTSAITGDLVNIGTEGLAKFCIKGVNAGNSIDYTHLYITQTNRPIAMQVGYGNVGIGTPSPSTKLEVNGGFKVTNNATIGGSLTVTGSATLNGTPTAPTASAGTNTTQIATTAFVTTADTSVLASAKSYTDTSISNLFWSGTLTEYNALADKSQYKMYIIEEDA
jgi:hypothetical protein